ncbi:MAG: hypothetical protein WED00_03505 [Aquisalimonadaceae bacterium]
MNSNRATGMRDQMWVPSAELVNDIVKHYGTPTFIYDCNFAERNFKALRHALDEHLELFYSLKANPNISIAHHLCGFGAGAEVSSLAELRTALDAGVAPQDIIFVGPAKSRQELRACIANRIYAIVCESIDELTIIDTMMAGLAASEQAMPVMLRVNPEFSGAGSGLAMSGKPRQFGIDEQQVRSAADVISDLRRIEVIGFHVYMGTRYLDVGSIVENTRNILALADSLAAEMNITLKAVDVGGGLGVPYFENEQALNIKSLGARINCLIDEFRESHSNTRLIMELGRYLVAGCGVMLSKVRYIKESMGETFAITDGGTNLHMAAVGIGSFVKRNFPMVNFSSTSSTRKKYTVTGPLCTPNDTVGKRVTLPEIRTEDVLGTLISGAYGPTASPTSFLSHGYPAEVLVTSRGFHLIRARDKTADILEKQVLITSLSEGTPSEGYNAEGSRRRDRPHDHIGVTPAPDSTMVP